MSIATVWGVTVAEQQCEYPCDLLMPAPARRLLRGVDVAAPVDVVYRWLCQIRAAPYSYDWIDNRGRRSPGTPLPWCWELEIGQSFSGIFMLDSFVVDKHLTLRMAPGIGMRLYGDVAITYSVATVDNATCSRLVAVLRAAEPTSRSGAIRTWLLSWGDLVMMRKQLRTLAGLAAAEHAARSSDGRHLG